MCDQQSLKSACAYSQSDQSLCKSLENTMSVKLLTEHRLSFLSLKVGCTESFESTLVKIPKYWKSHVAAHIIGLLEPVRGISVLIASVSSESSGESKPSLLAYMHEIWM